MADGSSAAAGAGVSRQPREDTSRTSSTRSEQSEAHSQARSEAHAFAAWNCIMKTRAAEVPMQVLTVNGILPVALHGGRYLLNGPGWLHVGGAMAHPFGALA
jgi:carotenoid cleavage dioxygenase-like enzyme